MKLRDILTAKASGEELRIRVGNKFMPINACEFDFPNVVIVTALRLLDVNFDVLFAARQLEERIYDTTVRN